MDRDAHVVANNKRADSGKLIGEVMLPVSIHDGMRAERYQGRWQPEVVDIMCQVPFKDNHQCIQVQANGFQKKIGGIGCEAETSRGVRIDRDIRARISQVHASPYRHCDDVHPTNRTCVGSIEFEACGVSRINCWTGGGKISRHRSDALPEEASKITRRNRHSPVSVPDESLLVSSLGMHEICHASQVQATIPPGRSRVVACAIPNLTVR